MFTDYRFIRFILVGGLNTVFGFVIYTLFALTDLSTAAVLIVSNVFTVVFNFCTTGGLVFRQLRLATLPRFLGCYILIFLCYLILINSLSPLVGGRIWAMSIVVIPISLLTYFMQTTLVFRSNS